MFEITIQRKIDGGWPIVAVLTRPGGGLPARVEATLRLDPTDLRDDGIDPRAYGRRLGEAVFADSIRDVFHRATDRVHVLLHVEADDLQSLRWERLCGPASIGWDFLGLDQRTPFAQYLPSATDGGRYPPFGRTDLRALVVAACPRGLEAYSLPEFDPAAAAAAVRDALAPIPCDVLADGCDWAVGPPTLDAICGLITTRRYPILHIICHGGRRKETVRGREVDDNWLYLAKEDGTPHPVGGEEFLTRLGRLGGPAGLPHLAFLAACESATAGGRGAVGGLAQRMVRDARLGMPVVLAMTETVSVETATRLTAGFYARLREHGEPDLALTQACAGLAGRTDVTVPALYTRLGGRPLFSNAPDRPLTVAEFEAALGVVGDALRTRAPVLIPEFEAAASAGRGLLTAEYDNLTDAAKAARDAAQARIGAVTLEALDAGFAEVALGKTLGPPPLPDCPFPGLYPFRPDDEKFFHGREPLVDELAGRLAGDNFLAVLGPSGSGKSSVVLAGLVPRLRADQFKYLTPGDDPLGLLELALTRTPDLMVVDQFEEVFTLCDRPTDRRRFADRLAEVSRNIRVVVTMRADFWGDCAALGPLRDLMERRQKLVGPMTPGELRSAVQQQAAAAGLEFEAGLAGVMVDEVSGEPGAMPLLQHALQELWKRRRGRWLTAKKVGCGGRAEYDDPEWVRRSIAATAEDVYQALSADNRDRVRDVFTRLTRLGEDGADGDARRDTRQRVRLTELTPAGADPGETKRLVATLANEGARLLVTGVQKGEETVEVAHEALIRHWPRLRIWLDDDRAVLRLRESVRAAAVEWAKARADDSLLVHRGARLAEAERLTLNARSKLNTVEAGYLAGCVALRERERTEQEERHRKELEQAQAVAELQRGKLRNLRIFAGVAVALLAVATILGGAAYTAYDREKLAVQNETEAKKKVADALARANAQVSFMSDLFQESNPLDFAGSPSRKTQEISRNMTAIQLLDKGIARLRVRLTGQPETRAALLRVIGATLRDMGYFDKSKPLLEEALALTISHHDRASAELASVHMEMGQLAFYTGDFDRSLHHFNEAVSIYTNRIPSDDRDLQLSTCNMFLAWIMLISHDPHAEPMIRNVISTRSRILGNDHKDVIIAKAGLASWYIDNKMMLMATPLILDILKYSNIHGDTGNIAAFTDFGIGATLNSAGLYAPAVSKLKSALDHLSKSLGDDHPFVSFVHNELGFCYANMNNTQQAKQHLLASLNVIRDGVGLHHPRAYIPLANYAELCGRNGDYIDGSRYFEDAIRQSSIRNGAANKWQFNLLSLYSIVEARWGDYDKAIDLANRAVKIYEISPEPPPYKKNVLNNILKHLKQSPKYNQASCQTLLRYIDINKLKSD